MKLHGRKHERNKDELRKLAQKDGNKFCFDCGMRGPLYVVTDFYIFVCSTCAALHRSLQHRVKGMSMTEFTEEEVAGLRVGGNDRASKVWLHSFNGVRPRAGDESSVRGFIVRVFDSRAHAGAEEFNRFQEDVLRALQPEAAPPLPGSAPSGSAPSGPAPSGPAPSGPAPSGPATAPPALPPKETATDDNLFEDFFTAPAPVAQAPKVDNAVAASNNVSVRDTAADLFAPAQVQDSPLSFFSVQHSSVQPPQQQQQQQNNQQFAMQRVDMQGYGSVHQGGYGYSPFVSHHHQQQQQPQQPQQFVPLSSAPTVPYFAPSKTTSGNGSQPYLGGGPQNLGNLNFFQEQPRDPWTFSGSNGMTSTPQKPKSETPSQEGNMHANAFASLDPFGAPR